MRILLTGASGFIGKSVASAARAALPDAELFGLSRSSARPTDILDPEQVAALVREARPTHVVHAAGGHGRMGPREQFLLHPAATEHLLRALRELDVPPVFVNVGSAAQYGPQAPGSALSEQSTDRPVSAYGVAKVAQELLVRAADQSGSVRATYLRVFNPIGPGQGEDMLVPTILRQLRAASGRRAEVVLGSLDDERDFLDVRDVGGSVISCLRSEAVRGVQLNVCSGVATSVRALAQGLAQVAGVELALNGRPAAGPSSYSRGDPQRLRQLLGSPALISLTESLSAIWSARR